MQEGQPWCKRSGQRTKRSIQTDFTGSMQFKVGEVYCFLHWFEDQSKVVGVSNVVNVKLVPPLSST
jgi:hypothetical protein